MNCVIDVQYQKDSALAAALLFSHWQTDQIEQTILKPITFVAPYQSGAFFKRELPCILALLEEIHEPLEFIIIDGFVTLGKAQKEGLGMHLYNALNQSIPIIGVAKNAFSETPKETEILRGQSQKPLYISAVGISLNQAKQLIQQMHGEYRIPTLLKKVDQLCREIP